MNRTYWALALGCNAIVIDSVYCALDHWLFEHQPAYRFWKIVKTIDAFMLNNNSRLGSVTYGWGSQTTTECITQQLCGNRCQVEWPFPTDASILSLRPRVGAIDCSDLRLHWRPNMYMYNNLAKTHYLGRDDKDCMYSLPALLREIEQNK